MESISPVIVLLNRNTKQFELSETVNDFEIKNMSKSKIIKKCSICGSSSLGHRPIRKKQLCSFRQLVKCRGNRKSLPTCDPCRQHLDQLIKLKEEINQLTVAMEALAKLIKLKMKYQEIAGRKSDSDLDVLNDEDETNSSSTLSADEQEAETLDTDKDENPASDDDDVKPVIVNYEDDDPADPSYLTEGRKVREEIIWKPEIKYKRPGPWSKTRKNGTVVENAKEGKTKSTESEDMSSFLKLELKEEEEQNVENWALCSFSDQGSDRDTEMILPDDNDNKNGIPKRTRDQFITQAETTEAFLPSDYSTGGDLPSKNCSTLDPETAPPTIIRVQPPQNIIRLLPTTSGQRERFITEAVCPKCGTRSRDLQYCEYCKARLSNSTKTVNIKEFKKTDTEKHVDLDESLCKRPTKKLKSSLPENGTQSSSNSEIVKIIKVPHQKPYENLLVDAFSSKHGGNEGDNLGVSQESNLDEDDDEIQVVSEKLAPTVRKPAPSNFSPDTKITLQCRTINVGTYRAQAAGQGGFILATICQNGIEFAMLHTQCGRTPVKCCIPMQSITQVEIHPHVISLSLQGKSYLKQLRSSLGFSKNPKDANYHYHPHSTNPCQTRITLISHNSLINKMPILKFLIPSPAYTLYALNKVKGVHLEKIIRLTERSEKINMRINCA
ncbi:uncharacterized protein LOC110854856 [Folsomia candida]|uniref:uncharacterized protein LOC110854856 n=1 Tax=Folsomia candida TaxID=158441 RepID=UPI000B8FDAA1|nr:uncharacterized protein LOC110854856 [Folsomia candida]